MNLRSPTSERKQMSRRYLACMSLLVLITGVAPGQAPKRAGTAPRTPWGEPDIQGIWDFATITPLERPKELAGKEFLTEEEAVEQEAQAAQRRVDRPPRQGDTGSYNQFWFD